MISNASSTISKYTSTITLNRRIRSIIGGGLSLMIVASLFVISGIFAIVNANSPQLKFSSSSNRSNPVALNGATINTNAYVFVEPIDVKKVTFYLDESTAPGAVPLYTSVENYTPFDFAHTAKDKTAKPYDFSKLASGTHKIRAVIIKKDGSTVESISSFSTGIIIPDRTTTTKVPLPTTATTQTATTQTTAKPVTTTSTSTTTTTQPQIIKVFKNDWIIYSSSQETKNVELYVSKTDGTQRTRVTNDPAYSNAWPRVTSDGKTVYFYRIPPDTSTSNYAAYSLWSMNIDGSNLKQIFAQGYAGWFLQGHVDIAPDNKHLVFAAIVPWVGLVLYVCDMDGKNLKAIPTNTQNPIDPAFTPDGRILFTAQPSGAVVNDENIEVFITTQTINQMLADPKLINSPEPIWSKPVPDYKVPVVRLTNDTYRDHDPAMSPDGKNIAILSLVEPGWNTVGKWAQRIINSDGTNVRFLIGPDHWSANARWVDNETLVYPFFDWTSNVSGWGINITKIDGSSKKTFITPTPYSNNAFPIVQDPFAFNK